MSVAVTHVLNTHIILLYVLYDSLPPECNKDVKRRATCKTYTEQQDGHAAAVYGPHSK